MGLRFFGWSLTRKLKEDHSRDFRIIGVHNVDCPLSNLEKEKLETDTQSSSADPSFLNFLDPTAGPLQS